MTAALQTHSLHKRYGSRVAVQSLDLDVAPGTVFGLVGPNGAGKTTTIRMLLDIIRPSSGSIRVLGDSPRVGGAALRRRIGYIPGELRLDGRMRGRTLLDFLTELSGPVAPGTIDTLAERLGLDLRRPVHTLSKGNKQKLGLIQAFMHRPPLLILDEPTSGLDPLVQREFLSMVAEARAAGQTVLLSSHVLSEIQQAADRVAVLASGRLVAEGTVEELRSASVRRVRAVVSALSEEAVRAALAALPTVTDVEVMPTAEALHVAATVTGEVDGALRALLGGHLIDLTVEEPDLEESLIDLYARTEGAR
ncbi:ABC transporter ATP-binding protein [Microbacterium sp. TNHR37B]|uniref:ABC transporter ATP-binding protein n=1 Tax=Microbacterium sp. TNHR37B TaxID=1775956 RepID=UPI0007B1C27E|nr:ABC transporter ATP-binding protein [Microbacterium sp. TNHR37B]KZE89402.1 Daunorubicin/doxorubicin resistance ATP-binding protein DrrA [Microbacterium sp. TNHR37B]